MADRRRLGPEHHAAHDRELVARAAAGDLAAGEAILARDQLAACPACAQLASDLRVLAAATRDLLPIGAHGAPVPAAPRDFRIAAADAARLRRRRWLDPARLGLATGRARGLGGALATLGLVGLLVTAAGPALLGGAAGGIASDLVESTRNGGSTSQIPAAAAPGPSGTYALSATDAGAAPDIQSKSVDEAPVPSLPILGIASVLAVIAGLALLLASRSGRRAGP